MSQIDSKTILDCGGANQLIGRGDMLILIREHLSVCNVHSLIRLR